MARVDPYKNYRFKVEIKGVITAGFMECSGFGSEVQVVEYREGGDATTARKLPGMAKYPDITLKWGITDSMDLYNWHLDAVNGKVTRQNGSIVILDEADPSKEKARWNFFGAWASKYTGPSFNAKGNDVAIDTFTIVCERLERVKV
ncbi:phage tail protein [Leptothermofonsia sichuanensis E412]|jgi:phage tail-like protein|uniref:phage tail protein n=1 Tax=Leptothermofonsia sichuanensis TaxID=2917832 RepID=UPI001CA60F6E|nr:phage tail protein [Leptothermofonsia sichuanensis]QZZ22026.1 phage tail protein [Leptothermofonsia sichuanensis E412]